VAVGDSVLLTGSGLAGVARFVGPVHYAKGDFVGVELATPHGKNDGEVKGERYFSCRPMHGILVRPSEVIARP